jgi:hypothetical protein
MGFACVDSRVLGECFWLWFLIDTNRVIEILVLGSMALIMHYSSVVQNV